LYHPDTSEARLLPPEVAQARFQSISTAYDVLRGKSSTLTAGQSARNVDATATVRRARQRRRADFEPKFVDDRWKDGVFIGLMTLTVVGFIAQMMTASYSRHNILNSMQQSKASPRSVRYDPEQKRRDEAALSATDTE
jgi:curved DNA-binding protein CbpA